MKTLLSNRLSKIAFAAWMIAAPVAAIADDTADDPIVGRWVTRVVSNATNPPTNIYSLSTFYPGGQTLNDDTNTTLHIASQGEWIKIGPRQYIRSMLTFNFDPPRTFTGFSKNTNFIELNEAGDEYDAEGFVAVYDVNGNLTATRVNPSHARRCSVAMTLAQCIGTAPLTKSSD